MFEEVEFGARRLIGSEVLGVFDDADDGEPDGRIVEAWIEPLPDRAALPEAPRQRLIDDDHRLRLIGHIQRLEGAPFERANPQGLEVALADDVPEIDVGGRPVRHWHIAFDLRIVGVYRPYGRQLS